MGKIGGNYEGRSGRWWNAECHICK